MRLPKAVRFETEEVRIRRHGRSVILEPVADDWDWLQALVGPADDDFASAVTDKPGEQERPALDFFE
ncbi:MAG: AbrB/MazE/SpoVT family DNA-binding domain-containing protein [Acidobacteriales bacterium]|nr:AbrB/MazE/SpoVT family DNA-binding domain-containing protein [Terriglobales bacterium]